jgi:hypothetical protein
MTSVGTNNKIIAENPRSLGPELVKGIQVNRNSSSLDDFPLFVESIQVGVVNNAGLRTAYTMEYQFTRSG